MTINIIKLGGNEIDSPEFLQGLVPIVAKQSAPPIIVHGGGKEITALGKQFGLIEKRIEGLRVTDEAYLQCVEMAMGGVINHRLVRTLNMAGAQALGLRGGDVNLLRAEPLKIPQGDLGFVGHITQVNTEFLKLLLSQGIIPVIASIAFGFDGNAYNINADHAALAVAKAMNADALLFVTNVQGVKIDGTVISQLTPNEIKTHIASGQISGGMIPKVKSATEAIEAGVRQVVICDLDGLKNNQGTVIKRD
jgi:acetylglutamate kinase